MPIERSQQRARTFGRGDGQSRPSEDERVLRPRRGVAFKVCVVHGEGKGVVGRERVWLGMSGVKRFSAFGEPSSVTGAGNRQKSIKINHSGCGALS